LVKIVYFLDYGKFIQFEPVTLVPFEPKLIDVSKLSREQVDWLNQYNSLVLSSVGTR
jgi:hypothetical protein